MKKRIKSILKILAAILAVMILLGRCGTSTTGKISKPITTVESKTQQTDTTLSDRTALDSVAETAADGVDGATANGVGGATVNGVDGATADGIDGATADGVDGATVNGADGTTEDNSVETTIGTTDEGSVDATVDSFDPMTEITDKAWVAYDYNYNNGYPMYVLNFRSDGTMEYMAGWVKSEIAFLGEGTWTSSGDQITYSVTGDGYTFNGTLSFVLVAGDNLTLSHVSGDALNYLMESAPMEFVVQGSAMDQPPI